MAVDVETERGTAMTSVLLFMADPWIDLDRANAEPAVAERWRLTTDRAALPTADVVVYPMPLWQGHPPVTRAHARQVHVLWSQESAVHYPPLLDPDYADQFDLRATYRLDSDVPIPYLTADLFDSLTPLTPLDQRHEVPVSAWVSSTWDRCGRDRYLLDLMEHVAVHSFGRVGHNHDLTADTGWHSKMATIADYRFTVAFENSITDDYVTEKFFQPLLAGSVPIYRGAPNVAQFAPAPHSYIDAAEFSGPAELASVLRSMTDEQYMRYHEWRTDGPTAAWRQRFRAFSSSGMVRLISAVKVVQIGLSALAATQPAAGRPSSSRSTGPARDE